MSDQGKGVWCVAETRHGKLSPTIYELLTAGRKIASARSEPLLAVVPGGPGMAQAAKSVAERGADKVLVLEHEALTNFLDEAYAAALKALAQKEKPRTILLPATVYGRSLASRLAVELKAGLAADAIEVAAAASGRLEIKRSAYAGNVVATVALKRSPEMVTVRPMAFERAEPAGKAGEVAQVPVDPASWGGLRSRFDRFSADESGEIDLTGAEKIVSGGRGLGGPDGFKLIRELARTIGAAVGASRATVDAGWIPYKHQVGLTGRSVRPRLYIACGISGQIQHLAGMKSSDVIVAVNTDPDCPMMKLANYAVQGDVYKILPALIDEIKRVRGN